MKKIVLILLATLSLSSVQAQEFDFGCFEGSEVTITGNYAFPNLKIGGYKSLSIEATNGWDPEILAVLYGNTNGFGGTSIEKAGEINLTNQGYGLWGNDDTEWLFIVEITKDGVTQLNYVPFTADKYN